MKKSRPILCPPRCGAQVFKTVSYLLTLFALVTSPTILVGSHAATQDNFIRLPMHGFSVGNYFEYICPRAGPSHQTVLTGLKGYTGVWLDKVQGVCSELYYADTPELEYRQRGAVTAGQIFGNSQRPFNVGDDCPDTKMVVGVRTNNYFDENALGQVELICSENPSRGPATEAAARNATVTLGGSGEKGPTDTEYCPVGAVVVGFRGHADQFLRMFGLICGPNPYDRQDARKHLTSGLSFQSLNYPDRYIRHRNFLGYLEPDAGNLAAEDASFNMAPGLAGRCSSFESRYRRGYFLRHQGSRLKLAKLADDPLFRQDATFCIVRGLANLEWSTQSEWVSLESVNYPGHFLRHRNFELWLDRFDSTDLFKKDATFKLTPPRAF